MSRIHFNLPTGATIRGFVPDSLDDPNTKREDLATIVLANGVEIDIGWYPQRDPTGQFVLSVYYEDWDNFLQDEWCAAAPDELKRKVDLLIDFWASRGPIELSEEENEQSLRTNDRLTSPPATRQVPPEIAPLASERSVG